jgi:N-acetylmuramoyl-L-alanine amidase
MTRENDYFVTLGKRREIARNKYNADLFVSVHADAATDTRARGASVFALSRRGATSTMAENLAKLDNESDIIGGVKLADKDDDVTKVRVDLAMEGSMDYSLKVGKQVLDQLSSVTPLHSQNVEQAGFMVLKNLDVPSILVETGFISNPAQEKQLASRAYQHKIAASIAAGVERYFSDHPPPNTHYAQQEKPGRITEHKIQRGESLSTIAGKYAVSQSALRAANQLRNDHIEIGQVLRIPQS